MKPLLIYHFTISLILVVMLFRLDETIPKPEPMRSKREYLYFAGEVLTLFLAWPVLLAVLFLDGRK